MVHNPPWWVYLDHSTHYNEVPHFHPLLPPGGVGHLGSAMLGLQLHPEGVGVALVLFEGREQCLAILPYLPVSKQSFLTPLFAVVSPQDVGSLDEKMKSLDVNQDSELKFSEYWRLIGELAKEMRKEKALEIRKK